MDKLLGERGILWGIRLDQPPPKLEPRLPARLSEVETADPALAAAMGAGSTQEIQRRLATGRRCWAAWIGDVIAAYGWVSVTPEYIGEQERELKLAKGEAYIWDCATLPPYRGARLYSALLCSILQTLRAEGLERAWIGTSIENHASLRGFANAGFTPLVTLTYIRLIRLRVMWIQARAGAPSDLVAHARRALIADDERGWGPLRVRWLRGAVRTERGELST